MTRRIDPNRVRDLWQTGAKLETIARRLGCSTSWVSALAAEAGLCRRPSHGTTRRRVVELARTGRQIGQIARQLGLDRSTVEKHLRRAGVTPPPVDRRAAVRKFREVTGTTVGPYVAERKRVAAVLDGWPPSATGPTRRAVLAALYAAGGPLTRAELDARLGTSANATRSALAGLVAAGAVERTPGYPRVRGRRGRPGQRPRYAIAPDVRAVRDRMLAYESARQGAV